MLLTRQCVQGLSCGGLLNAGLLIGGQLGLAPALVLSLLVGLPHRSASLLVHSDEDLHRRRGSGIDRVAMYCRLVLEASEEILLRLFLVVTFMSTDSAMAIGDQGKCDQNKRLTVETFECNLLLEHTEQLVLLVVFHQQLLGQRNHLSSPSRNNSCAPECHSTC